MTDSTPRLRGENLTLGYGKKIVARDLTVAIPDGHFTAIIGPNGCGKSTLLRTLSRLMTPVAGSVFLDGEQIQRFASKEVARRIGLLAQNATTPGDITVQELVSRGRYPHQPLFTRWRKEDDDAVNRAMRATGITDLAQQSVDTLSGGQRQRAWIAMVLAQETSIMLLDEPTTWLDISHQIDLLELLSDLNPHAGLYPGGGAARPESGMPLRHAPDCAARRRDRGAGCAERDCDAGSDRADLRHALHDY
ncbi:ABC transporter-like protein [Enterobacter cancerogenus]|uniref:ABC transporter-like protein n=1 Tax=Enterobacter cancerogenus TaxID=69218 RepID=A0A484X0Q8_9ENTR|nr:ABC transporter-like protein [Enterobacter cancerogenus]